MARRDHPPDAARAARERRGQATDRNGRDLREAILDAAGQLLAERRFDQLSVADILAAAGVARGSFYFYFESKYDVLAELVRRAIAQGHQAAQSWLTQRPDNTAALRAGSAAGAQVWHTNGPVLRAIVENWQTDPRLTALWLNQMQTFTDAIVGQISTDPELVARLSGLDVTAVASGLTWFSERLYYLAACGVAPFDEDDTLVDTLVHVWTSVLYGAPVPTAGRSTRSATPATAANAGP